jgi:hypothetical protein
VSDDTEQPGAPDEPIAADPEEAGAPDLPGEGGDEPAAEGATSRALPIAVVVLVVVIVVAAVAAWVLSSRDDGPRLTGSAAADALVEAYTRNLDATFRVEGELTRTLDDGRTLSSAYLSVQRPPDHIQRALGSTTGDVGGRTVNCSSTADGTYSCATSAASVPWEQQRATTLGALESYVKGDDPVYDVTLDSADCFVLVRRRTEPDATYGRGARLCFDERFAALRRLEVDREGGATDVMLADRITDEVTGADFDLQGDSTYDPSVPDDTGAPPTSA